VWISPIAMQGADSMQHAGYHGYWPSDHYQVNPSFGSQQDLQDLMQAYRNKGESACRPKCSPCMGRVSQHGSCRAHTHAYLQVSASAAACALWRHIRL
jgi:hypothetical protein